MTRGVYLAGPDVFHPDHGRIFTERRATCRRHGLAPLTPLDSGATAAEDENAFLRPDQGRPAPIRGCIGMIGAIADGEAEVGKAVRGSS